MKQFRTNKRHFGQVATVTLLLLVCSGLVLLPGCSPSDSSDSSLLSDENERFQKEYFQYAMKNLQRIDQFSGGEMRQEIIGRLNQWIPSQSLPSDWEADPMLKGLPIELDSEMLGAKHFSQEDGYALQQAIWMRGLSDWVGKDLDDPVERSAELFDWIVRNVQLQKTAKDGFGKIPKQPWETLFFGRGTAVDRAWVLVLAARQQSIDAVVLMVPSKEDPKKLIPWAIGVLKDKELYLFGPELGLPIPAKDGVALKGTRLEIKPATLSEVVNDPSILKQLDLSETAPYPFSAEQVQKAVAMIVASESSLSARFALVESRMAGKNRAVLTIKPSALAKDLREVKGLSEDRIQLWDRPFVVDQIRSNLGPQEKAIFAKAKQPFLVGTGTPLWKGRAAHIMGKLIGPKSATVYYQKARPSNRKLFEYEEMFVVGNQIKIK